MENQTYVNVNNGIGSGAIKITGESGGDIVNVVASRVHDQQWRENFWSIDGIGFDKPRQEILDFVFSNTVGEEREVRVADVGAGDGRYSIPFAIDGYAITAIDYAEKSCNLIKQRAKSENVHVDVIQSDFIPSSKNGTNPSNFDFVISSGLVSQPVDEDDQYCVVIGLQNMVKDGGILILKYCLWIKDRGDIVAENFVLPLFGNDKREILTYETEKDPRKALGNNPVENELRTQTIIARKKAV